MGLEKGCPCYKVYKEDKEFIRVLQLENAGLVIYRYIPTVNNKDFLSQPEKTLHTDDVFIIHNTKNRNVSTSNYMSEFEQAMNCPRCRYIVKHTKELLLNVPFIKKKDVIGICDQCRFKKRINERCNKCQLVVKEFLKQHELKQKERRDSNKQEKVLTSEIEHILKDVPKAVYTKSKSQLLLDTSLKSFGYKKSPTYCEAGVKDMFEIKKKAETNNHHLKKEFLKQIGTPKIFKNLSKSGGEVTFIEAKRSEEHNEPGKNILFNPTENISWPENLNGSAEFIGFELDIERPSTKVEKYLKKENIFSPMNYGTQKWPIAKSDIHAKENINNKKKDQQSYDDINQDHIDLEVYKPSQREDKKKLRMTQNQSRSLHNVRRYSSEDLLKFTSASTFVFLKETDVVTKPLRKLISSSELIKGTEDMYREKAEERKVKKEKLKEKLEPGQQKSLAKIKSHFEEERRLEKLKKITAEQEFEKKNSEEELEKQKAQEKLGNKKREEELKKKKENEELEKKKAEDVIRNKQDEEELKKKKEGAKFEKKNSEEEHEKKKAEEKLTNKQGDEKLKKITIEEELKKKNAEEELRNKKRKEELTKKKEEEKLEKKNSKEKLKKEKAEEKLKNKKGEEELKKQNEEKEQEFIKNILPKQNTKSSNKSEKTSKEPLEKSDNIRLKTESKESRKDKILKSNEEKQRQKEGIEKENRNKAEQMRNNKEKIQRKEEEKKKEKSNKTEKMRDHKEEEQKGKNKNEKQEAQLLIKEKQKLREKEGRPKPEGKERNRYQKEENEIVSKDRGEFSYNKLLKKHIADRQKHRESILTKKKEEESKKKVDQLKLKSLKGTKGDEESKKKDLYFNQVKIRKNSDADILQLVKLNNKKVSVKERPTRMSQINIPSEILVKHMEHKNKKTDNCIICLDSDLELDIENIRLNETMSEEVNVMIVGTKIFKYKPSLVKKKKNKEFKPLFYNSTHTEGERITEEE